MAYRRLEAWGIRPAFFLITVTATINFGRRISGVAKIVLVTGL